MTQTEKILKYLQENGGITQLQAAEYFGCYRLGARIWELKKAGYRIKKTMVTGINRYGGSVAFARYWLDEKDI